MLRSMVLVCHYGYRSMHVTTQYPPKHGSGLHFSAFSEVHTPCMNLLSSFFIITEVTKLRENFFVILSSYIYALNS